MKRFLFFFLLLISTPGYAQWQVAILPYENRTDDPQQEWLARGISESMLVAFYKVPQIRLTDETILGTEWKSAVGNASLMNTKNIHVVIRGWYQEAGDQYKIHSEIVEASNGKIRKTISSNAHKLPPQETIANTAFALATELNVTLDDDQKTAIQTPITSHSESYRATINAIRTFRQATHLAQPNSALLSQAETSLIQAKSRDQKNAHALYYLGRIYELRHNMREAEDTYRQALAHDFEHVMARYHLAMLYKKQGRSSEALVELEQTLRQSPLNPDIQSAISGLFFSQYEQTFESLATPLQEMIQAAPDDPTGYFELGNVYDELYRYTEAASYYEQALERDSTLADAHFKLGLIYHRKSQHEKAIYHLSQAAQYGTQYNRVYFRLGEIYYLLKQYDKATTQFKKAIETEPNYLIPRYHLGLSQLAQGQPDVALQTFLKYADLTIDDARPHIQIGNIYRQKGNIPKAITAYEKALEISLVETEAHYQVAYLYAKQKKPAEAIKHLKTVLRLQPDHPDALTIQKDIQKFSK